MMDDLISRQAAIYALEAKKDKSAKGDIGCFYNTIIQNNIDALKGLPSAQSERKTDGDTISRQAAIDALDCINGTEEVLRSLPSAQPEIKTGRWIYEETQYKISSYRCSECGRHVLYESKSDVCEAYPYCHCGAKMLKNDEVYANEWLGL